MSFIIVMIKRAKPLFRCQARILFGILYSALSLFSILYSLLNRLYEMPMYVHRDVTG